MSPGRIRKSTEQKRPDKGAQNKGAQNMGAQTAAPVRIVRNKIMRRIRPETGRISLSITGLGRFEALGRR
jgi:hypothetical protein